MDNAEKRRIMKQKVFCARANPIDFEVMINDYIRDGWRVVPGSLQTSVSSCFDVSINGVRVSYSHVVVLEKC